MAQPERRATMHATNSSTNSAQPAQDPLDVETFNSQELMEYLNESRSFSLEPEDPTDDENQPEDGEEEAEWLRQAGFDALITAMEPTADLAEAEAEAEWQGLVTLSHRQAAVVKRRLHVLRDTLQKRRAKQRRRPDMRRLFPASDVPAASGSGSGSGSGGASSGGSPDSRSRSATPDSLDSLTPPLTPPERGGRRQSGSPHSQGYHSSRGSSSLDRLEAQAVQQHQQRSGELRHVLRIPVDTTAESRLPADLPRLPADPPRLPGDQSRLPADPPRLPADQSPLPADQSRLPADCGVCQPRRTHRISRDALRSRPSLNLEPELEPKRSSPSLSGERSRSRASLGSEHARSRPSLSLFESCGNYDLSRPSASSVCSGIEAVSFQPIGSVRNHAQLWRALARPTPPHQLTRDRPRVQRARSKPELGLTATGGASVVDAAACAHGHNQVASEERLGRTRLGDLSEADVLRVQKLALLEVTALYDEHGLSCSGGRKPGRRRRRLGTRITATDTAVFGASLTSLLKRDQMSRPDAARGAVPLLFEKIISYLERQGVSEEGLLRVPGHRQKTEQLRQLLDERFYSSPAAVEAAIEGSSPADVAALLKQLLRQLPVPLLTDESLDAFPTSDALPDPEEQAQALCLLCLRLPAANRALLRRLLSFLAQIAAHQSVNKMSLENVAVIMAPNLIPARRRRQKDISAEIAFASVTSRVVRRLVQHRQRLWEVPAQFVRQIRQQHEQQLYERARRDAGGPIKLLLRRRETAIVRKIDNEVDFQEGVLRVCAPQLGRPSWPVRLASDTTAGQLINRCLREWISRTSESPPGSRRPSVGCLPDGGPPCSLASEHLASALHTHFLHEHGGNIGERRLDHGAFLLDCYQENPNARWVLHCCHGPAASAAT